METQQHRTYRTRSGLVVEHHARTVSPEHLDALTRALDTRRGALFCSTFEYPGRYTRQSLAFVDPPLVLEARGDEFTLRALYPRGELLLEGLACSLGEAPELELAPRLPDCIAGRVRPSHARFSEEERTRRPSIFSVVRCLTRALAHPDEPRLGLYGALGYDLVLQLEQLRLAQARDGARDLVLYLPDQLLVSAAGLTQLHSYEFRLAEKSTHGRARGGVRAAFVPASETGSGCDHGPLEFERGVERARRAFLCGDLFEVTLSQTFTRAFAGSPSALFTRLCRSNPAPYGFLINLGEGELLVGASPEMYVRVSGARVETCPIAGTIARGADALEDAAQIKRLLGSDKDEAELTMCTDVDRNDKARICEAGSVRVLGRRQIELYARLIHTVDHVEGRLRPPYDGLDALLTHMWAVTVTGAPKLDAMQFIEDHERSPRRFYGGAVGALRFDGSVDTGLVLRTIHLRAGRAEVRSGATLLYHSEPASERRESELKASALLAVLQESEPSTPPARVQARSRQPPLRVLLIDHRDSFVHTLADYFRQAGCEVTTMRHGFASSLYDQLSPELVVLSPGPKRPSDFGLRATLTELASRGLPTFGVCLGLQAMVEYAGGALEQLGVPAHGVGSLIRVVERSPLLSGLPDQLTVARYHSLSAHARALPSELVLLAEECAEERVMAIAHRHLPWHAVQFHPESILTLEGGHGLRLIENVVELARRASYGLALPRASARELC